MADRMSGALLVRTVPSGPARYTLDPDGAERLWTLSETLLAARNRCRLATTA